MLCLLATLSVSGCETSGPVTSGGCEWTKPIWLSRSDVLTDDTADQIIAHNETGSRICGQTWARPKKATR